jgi:hypothetical protein
MLNMVPGGSLIRKYIYRMIFGIICLPGGIALLFWNERNAIIQKTIFQGVHSDLVYWGFRLVGFLFLVFCFNRIFSAIKIFMSKIPLSYDDIRNLILFKAFMYSLAITLLIAAVCWISHRPAIAVVLIVAAVGFIVAGALRRGQKKKIEASKIPSAKPQRSKDV